jgi:hypothetical protein
MGAVHMIRPTVNSKASRDDDSDEVKYQSNLSAYSLSATPTPDGLDAKIMLKNKRAPKEHAFEFDDDVKLKAVTGTRKQAGEVLFVTAGGVYQDILESWAHDARGKPVKAFFIIKKNALVQKVMYDTKHNEFPIVADPDWGKIGDAVGWRPISGTVAGRSFRSWVP